MPDLEAGILFAMKQNLMIQFVYPDYEIPTEYQKTIETIDHHNIAPQRLKLKNTDAIVFDGCDLPNDFADEEKILVVRTSKTDFFTNYKKIIPCIGKVKRLNVVLTDIETFTENDFSLYKERLEFFKNAVKEIFIQRNFLQFNLLTDRILLDKMNNCNAGVENISLAPNGKFYICPAFYLEDETDSVGNLANGLNIKNKQLYKLDYAPTLHSVWNASVDKGCIPMSMGCTKCTNNAKKHSSFFAPLGTECVCNVFACMYSPF